MSAVENSASDEAKNPKLQAFYRKVLQILARIIGFLFTRTTVTGRENIPTEGPVLFCANHLSTYDAVLMLTYLPSNAQFVGPGDFKLLWPANIVVKNLGIIMVDRGAVDRQSLKRMEAVLKEGGLLGLFPEGGTWEKGIEDVKSGATYLSLTTGARIVPIALGGTYQVWSKMARLKRPKVTVHFGKPLDPITVSGDRKTRQAELQTASVDLMRQIYAWLPKEDQEFYDLIPRQRFRAELSFSPNSLTLDNPPALSALTELISKPNLFSPLHKNAKLPLRPFVERLDQFTPAAEFDEALRALQGAFNETFKGYLEYRLGDEKAAQVYADISEFLPIAQKAAQDHLSIRFTPHISVVDEASAE